MEKANNKLSYHYTNIESVKKAYMPFVYDGAIFIPTNQNFRIGDMVDVDITLPTSNMPISFSGEIIWYTPAMNHDSSLQAGIGVQFNGLNSDGIKELLNELLAAKTDAIDETDTM